MRAADIVYNGIEENELYAQAARRGVLAALQYEEADGEIGVELTNDDLIHECNRMYRMVDRPTDVLSFPCFEGEQLIAFPDGHLGDIMISVETAARQAVELDHGTEREIMFLAIHGTLHILGYDHIEPEDEAVMIKKQKEIINLIGG